MRRPITKPILSVAILQLVEEGLLVLSDPITRVIPEFAGSGKPDVTAWHLLTHTSGLDETVFLTRLLNREIASVADCVAAACQADLAFQPGTRYAYCSLSFYLLGEVISRLSGEPYPDYLRRRIFTPLGMVDTGFSPAHAAHRAMPVLHMGGGTTASDEEALALFTALVHPGGGLWSTAGDLVTFGQACLTDLLDGTGRLLAPATMAWMAREHTTSLLNASTGQPAHYGLGWGMGGLDGLRPGSARVFEHGGQSGTRLWIDPDWNLIVVFLTNEWDADSHTSFVAVDTAYAALRG
ncbi:MAG: serine hydrolase domain-containing protein [Chloroflexota bacterium]